MKPVGKPDAGKLHVRFDERGGETERAKAPPRLSSTLLKRGKNDAVDAEAICEAVTRPTMRFVEIKSAEQQSVLMLHRTRELLVRQRTALINSLRGQLAEFGLIAPQGRLAHSSTACSRPGRGLLSTARCNASLC